MVSTIERFYCIQDTQLGPNGIHYREVPLYSQTWTYVHTYVYSVPSLGKTAVGHLCNASMREKNFRWSRAAFSALTLSAGNSYACAKSTEQQATTLHIHHTYSCRTPHLAATTLHIHHTYSCRTPHLAATTLHIHHTYPCITPHLAATNQLLLSDSAGQFTWSAVPM